MNINYSVDLPLTMLYHIYAEHFPIVDLYVYSIIAYSNRNKGVRGHWQNGLSPYHLFC